MNYQKAARGLHTKKFTRGTIFISLNLKSTISFRFQKKRIGQLIWILLKHTAGISWTVFLCLSIFLLYAGRQPSKKASAALKWAERGFTGISSGGALARSKSHKWGIPQKRHRSREKSEVRKEAAILRGLPTRLAREDSETENRWHEVFGQSQFSLFQANQTARFHNWWSGDWCACGDDVIMGKSRYISYLKEWHRLNVNDTSTFSFAATFAYPESHWGPNSISFTWYMTKRQK